MEPLQMEPLQYTFRNNGINGYNDDIFDHPAFDLVDKEYIFLLEPKTKFWRFGIALSKSQDFRFDPSKARYNDTSLKFIEINIGERSTTGNWSLPKRIELGCYNIADQTALPRYDTYIEQSALLFNIKYEASRGILNASVDAQGCPEFESDFLVPGFRYFKIFAWADFIDFEIECVILVDKPTQLSGKLIEENRKTRAASLDLSNCGMNEIPNEITELVWLEELIIGAGSYLDYETSQPVATINKGASNYLTGLPEEFRHLVNLKKLVIDGMNPTGTESADLSEISKLFNLTDLYIINTAFDDINLLTGLTKLKRVNLSNTRVDTLGALAGHKNIEALIFVSTKVSSITALGNLTGLKILLFDSTPVSDITMLADLTNLQSLTFSQTAVSDISSLSRLTDLLVLDCSFTKVRDIDALANLFSLQILHLHHTEVMNLSALSNLKSLEKLLLFKTKISDLSPLSGMSGLQRIDFSETHVVNIQPLENLANLLTANFEKCFVKRLHPIVKVSALEGFSCGGNPIEDCPADVYETGDIKQVRAYFDAKEWENIPVALEKDIIAPRPAKFKNKNENENIRRDIKLIVLGNSNSGKTNLVNYLETGGFTGIRNTTHGLEVHRWLPDEKRFPNLKDIAVSIWDFGGQEYYHGAYRLFLSDNALYVLLWCHDSNINGKTKTCLRDKEEPVDLENFELRYWFDTIRHYSGSSTNGQIDTSTSSNSSTSEKKIKSRLITLQNKVDDPDMDKKRIAQDLHEKYTISDSFHVSLLKGSSKDNPRQYKTLENFLSELEFALQNTADKGSIPVKWQLVRDQILYLKSETTGTNPFLPFIKNDLWISLSDFQQACRNFLPTELNTDEIYTVPRWLDKGGTIVYFPEITKLSDKIFLRPDLLAEKIYQVLNEKVRTAGGEFSADTIFDERQEELRTIFMELAQHLELIFPHPIKTKGKEFLAPQYLPDAHPIEDLFKIASYGAWQSDLWVKVPLFYYKKILHGVLLHYAADENTECRYFWKHGIMFMKNGLRVLIKGLYPEKEQHEGVILIGVEKDPQKQSVLQQEIFNKFQEIIMQKGKTGKTTNPASTATDNNMISQVKATDTNMSDINADIHVSYDGENYIVYKTLIENAAEPKVKAFNSNTLLITYNFAAILPTTPQKAKKVFLSYSHQNTAWLTRLRTHLAGLRRAKQIETWDDKEILPGDMWDTTIKKRIEEADVFILLLSADFIASEYIWNDELPKAFEKFKTRNATLIPILFEPIDLGGLSAISEATATQTYKINDFEIIPKTVQGHLKAVSLWDNQEEALAIIAQRIREAIRK